MTLLERFLIMTDTRAPLNKQERDAIYVRMRNSGYITENELKEMINEEFKNVI